MMRLSKLTDLQSCEMSAKPNIIQHCTRVTRCKETERCNTVITVSWSKLFDEPYWNYIVGACYYTGWYEDMSQTSESNVYKLLGNA